MCDGIHAQLPHMLLVATACQAQVPALHTAATHHLCIPSCRACTLQLEQMQAAESTGRKSLKDPAAPAPATLTDTCRVLADVAEPPNMKRAFETSLSVALLESQLSVLESTTGLNMLSRDRAGAARGVTLTGWTALAGVAAMRRMAGGATGACLTAQQLC